MQSGSANQSPSLTALKERPLLASAAAAGQRPLAVAIMVELAVSPVTVTPRRDDFGRDDRDSRCTSRAGRSRRDGRTGRANRSHDGHFDDRLDIAVSVVPAVPIEPTEPPVITAVVPRHAVASAFVHASLWQTPGSQNSSAPKATIKAIAGNATSVILRNRLNPFRLAVGYRFPRFCLFPGAIFVLPHNLLSGGRGRFVTEVFLIGFDFFWLLVNRPIRRLLAASPRAQMQSGRTNGSSCLIVLKNRSVTCVRGCLGSADVRGDGHGRTCGTARNRNPKSG